MANEIVNRQHAVGTFVPVVAPPFDKQILNSVGIDSFVRNSVGNYTVVLTDPIGFAGAQAISSLPANFLGIPGAQIAQDGGSVLITVFDLSGNPTDPSLITLVVRSVVEGQGAGPAPVLPGPPAPPGGTGLLMGWGEVDLNANLLAQTGLIQSTNKLGGGAYQWTLVAGLPALSAMGSQMSTQGAGVILAEVLTPTTARTLVRNMAGNVTDLRHTAYFYSL